MKVFVTGATGAIGGQLVPMLIEHGHEVVAMTRSPEKAGPLRAIGAGPVVADGLDRDAVVEAVVRAAPEAIVHEATALSGRFDFKHFDRFFEQTNRLRTRGTDILLEAARAAGTRQIVAQGYAGWPYRSDSPTRATEDEPFEPGLPEEMRSTVDAMRHLEAAVLGATDLRGVVLRYGSFYGPETSLWVDGDIVQVVRKRLMPVVGDGAGVWSFVHVHDAAAATVRALERSATGVYNIVDDEPAPVGEFLPELSRIVGAKPPRRIPAWLAKPLIGEAGIWLMTRVRGVSNAKAKAELGWTPGYPSWRTGFREGMGGAQAAVGA
jgi:nucleoside-diphosphate-sugar epimerase